MKNGYASLNFWSKFEEKPVKFVCEKPAGDVTPKKKEPNVVGANGWVGVH